VPPQVERPEPAYMQMIRTIRQQIIDGELPDGAVIPSVRELADAWGVSRATAEKALTALRGEGLVSAEPGRGTFVTAKQVMLSPRDRQLRMRRTGTTHPPNERDRITIAELVTAPSHVSDALGLESEATVIRRVRVTYRDDAPVSTSTSWYPGTFADAAPRLLEAAPIRGGAITYVAEATGRVAASGRDQVCAQSAAQGVADPLGLTPGSPVLAGRNWLYAEDGNVIEYGESYRIPNRWTSYDYAIT
jgi:DNA-binding GntR family transcriptional regulator